MNPIQAYTKNVNFVSSETRRYENAATRRIKGEDGNFTLPDFQSEKNRNNMYPIYKRPVQMMYREVKQVDQVKTLTDYQQRKDEEIIYKYKSQMIYGTERFLFEEVMNRTNELSTEERSPQFFGYSRFTIMEDHTKILWDKFNADHMVYFDDGKVIRKFSFASTGQIVFLQV